MHFSPILLSELPKTLAYLDPGTGSFLLQLALAALLGGAILIRAQWARIKKWFGGKPSEIDEEDEDEKDE